MKINLLIDNGAGVRSGYVNIDPYADSNNDSRISADLTNLSHTVDDGEATEIIAHDVLSYYPQSLASRILENWVKKLAYGGTITVSALDQTEVARHINSGFLTVEQANLLLHGAQEKDWDTIKSSFTLTRLAEALESLGLKIIRRRSSDYKVMVTARRVKPN